MLDNAGVPRDAKWRSLIVYLRGIADLPHLTDHQKTHAQRLFTQALAQKDFSEARFAQILEEYHASITESYRKTIDELVREASAVVKGFQDMLTSRYGDLEQLEETTVQTVGEIQDGPAVAHQLRQAFGKLKNAMESDLRSLEDMAHRDGLTGLFNRRSFDRFMSESVIRWQEEQQPLTLALFDIDHFKVFNDKYGHRVGDQVLTVVAGHIQHALQVVDQRENRVIGARYGGEEFAVVISGPAAVRCTKLVEGIRESIHSYSFLVRDTNGNIMERGLRVSVSCGIASMWPGWPGSHAENLIESADKALYFAKGDGRDRSAIFDPTGDQPYRTISEGK